LEIVARLPHVMGKPFTYCLINKPWMNSSGMLPQIGVLPRAIYLLEMGTFRRECLDARRFADMKEAKT